MIRKFPDPVTRCMRAYVGVVSLCTEVEGDEHCMVTYSDGDAEELDTPTLENMSAHDYAVIGTKAAAAGLMR